MKKIDMVIHFPRIQILPYSYRRTASILARVSTSIAFPLLSLPNLFSDRKFTDGRCKIALETHFLSVRVFPCSPAFNTPSFNQTSRYLEVIVKCTRQHHFRPCQIANYPIPTFHKPKWTYSSSEPIKRSNLRGRQCAYLSRERRLKASRGENKEKIAD